VEYMRVPTLVLIAQAVFLLERGQTYRLITLSSLHLLPSWVKSKRYDKKKVTYFGYGSVEVGVDERVCEPPCVVAASKKHVVVTVYHVDVVRKVGRLLQAVNTQLYLYTQSQATVTSVYRKYTGWPIKSETSFCFQFSDIFISTTSRNLLCYYFVPSKRQRRLHF